MCIFQIVTVTPTFTTQGTTHKALYVAENSGEKFEYIRERGREYKMYLWDGEAWIKECWRREQIFTEKRRARNEKRANKRKK